MVNEPVRVALKRGNGLAPQWLRPIILAAILSLHVALLVTMAATKRPAVTALGAVEVVMVAEGDSVAAAASKAVPLHPVKPPAPLPKPLPKPLPPPPPPPAPTVPPPLPVVQPVPAPPVSVPLPLKAAPDPVVLPPPPPKPDLNQQRLEQARIHKAELLKQQHLKDLARKRIERQKRQRQALAHAMQMKRLRAERMAHARAAARASAAARARRQGARHAVAAINGMSPATYGRTILMRIQAHKFFPQQARAQGVTGTVGIAFYVSRSGRITEASVTHSSGSGILDGAARRIVLSVQAPPPPHGSFRGSTSIRFALH